jgi:hypothetical protein
MDYVTPKRIMSPFSGEFSTPKLREVDYGDRIVTEAQWYCPRTGQFITKGTVKVEMKDQGQTPDKK